MITVIVVYCVLNFIIQSVLQPKFVGDAVGLTTTVSFLSLIIWAYLLGPIGAILAIPASLLVKALLVDVDPDAKWLQLFLGDEPVFKVKDPNRPKRFGKKKDTPELAAPAAATRRFLRAGLTAIGARPRGNAQGRCAGPRDQGPAQRPWCCRVRSASARQAAL